MNGMLLAAGRAERMEPLSSFVPKPCLDVLGEPLLASPLHQLRRFGCERLVVNLHRHSAAVAAAVRRCEPELARLRFSWEDELLGGAGGLAAARRHFLPGAVLAANADVRCDLDLALLAARAAPAVAVLAVVPHPDPRRWSSILLDGEGHVTAIVRRGAAVPGEAYMFSGFQVLGSAVVAALPDPPADMDVLWEPLLRRRALLAAVVPGTFREAGTPAAYRELVAEALAGRSWTHAEAVVDRQATLTASAVSAGCLVESGTRLDDTVVTAGAAVGRDCELRACVVAGPVRVEDGARLHGRLVVPSGDWPL